MAMSDVTTAVVGFGAATHVVHLHRWQRVHQQRRVNPGDNLSAAGTCWDVTVNQWLRSLDPGQAGTLTLSEVVVLPLSQQVPRPMVAMATVDHGNNSLLEPPYVKGSTC